MTIYTSTTVDKKNNCDPPEVVLKSLPDLQFKTPQTVGDLPDSSLLQNAPNAQALLITLRQRRRRTVLNLLLLLLTALLIAISFIIALSVYSGYRHTRPGYSGVCGVTYVDEENHYYEFKQEIYTDGQSFENISVPQIDNFNQATILHDFDTNWTAIVDSEQKRCFVKPLNRTTTKQPRDFWDLIIKIRTGYYLPDEQEVSENFRVIMPPVKNVMKYGNYIGSNCWIYNVYELESIRPGNGLEKRSACNQFKARHSTGIQVQVYNIIDC